MVSALGMWCLRLGGVRVLGLGLRLWGFRAEGSHSGNAGLWSIFGTRFGFSKDCICFGIPNNSNAFIRMKKVSVQKDTTCKACLLLVPGGVLE